MLVTVATRNPTKAAHIREVLEDLVDVQTLSEAGIEGEAEEDGTTLTENATKKALYAWERAHGWCVADDTGFFIDALDGAPGIYPARWAGEHTSTEEIMQYTLSKLEGVPLELRTAHFRTVAVLCTPNGVTHAFFGEVSGTILTEPQCPLQPKMPYSSIFVPEGETRVWAQMNTEEINAISHRGKALRKLRAFLEREVS